MEKLLSYMQGYVTIHLKSSMPERFMKLCAARAIVLWDVIAKDSGYEMKLSVKDFRKLNDICRKSHTRIHILKKSGMPFFFYRNKKRKAFFVGIICCMILLYLCSTRIWNIHIEGNYSNSTQSILKYLATKEIVHGVAKNDLNCSDIAANLRNQYKDITWVSARIKGTRLLISIQENMLLTSKKEAVQEEPCSIVADCEGRIVHMVTRKGVPVMTIGQQCTENDLLVLGRLELLNDNKEIVHYEYVQADADIYVERTLSYYDEFPMKYQQRVYTGKNHKKLCVQLFDIRLSLELPSKKMKTYDMVSTMEPVSITENFILPMYGGCMERREYKVMNRTHSERAAKEIASRNLDNYLRKLSEKGVKIMENNVKISIDRDQCIGMGTLTVIQKAGKKVSVERLPEPEERTPVDEQ